MKTILVNNIVNFLQTNINIDNVNKNLTNINSPVLEHYHTQMYVQNVTKIMRYDVTGISTKNFNLLTNEPLIDYTKYNGETFRTWNEISETDLTNILNIFISA